MFKYIISLNTFTHAFMHFHTKVSMVSMFKSMTQTIRQKYSQRGTTCWWTLGFTVILRNARLTHRRHDDDERWSDERWNDELYYTGQVQHKNADDVFGRRWRWRQQHSTMVTGENTRKHSRDGRQTQQLGVRVRQSPLPMLVDDADADGGEWNHVEIRYSDSATAD